MNSWRYVLGEFSRRPGRSLLSLLSVVIAVAAIVAVSSATATTRASNRRLYELLAGRADLEVASKGGSQFSEADAKDVRSLPHVRAVVPVLRRGTNVFQGEKKISVLVSAIVPDEPESTAGLQVTDGRLPTGAGEVAVEENLAANLKVKAGDDLTFFTGSKHTYKVTGVFALQDAAQLQQGGMLLMPLNRMQRIFSRASGQVDVLHIYLDDPKNVKEVMAAAAADLPSTLEIRVPGSRKGQAEEMLLLTEVSLLMASSLSFLTAVFIVLSVFLMNVSERRRQLAIYRAVGATRRQVLGMVCYEALLMGIAGTFIGIPLGVYGGTELMKSMNGLLGVQLPPRPDLNWTFIVGALMGPLVCLVASWYPARKASRVSPLEGLRPVVTLERSRGNRVPTIIGGVGLTSTAIAGFLASRGVLPIWASVATLVMSLIFAVLLLPACLRPAVALLAWPIRRGLKVEGEMSERLVLRHSTRSALTIGVLFIAVSTSLGIGNSVFTVNDDTHKWIDRTITADFLLRVMAPNASEQAQAVMAESLAGELTQIDGVDRVDAVKSVSIDVNGQKARLLTRDLSRFDRVPLYVLGDEQGVLERLLAGEAALGSVLAQRAGVHEGDTVEITAGDKKHSFRVAALVTEYANGGMVVTLDTKVADRTFHIEGVGGYFIKAKPGRAADVEPKLRELAADNGLLLQSFSEIVRIVDKTVAGTTTGLWVLLALGLVVGALGVVNTLTMNVLEQTRELGMLRAIGMRRRQIIKTVLGQAGIIGWLGILTGVASGMGLAHTFNQCLGSLFGRYMQFSWRPEFVATLAGAALVVVVVSALVPARRAANLNPLESMRQD